MSIGQTAIRRWLTQYDAEQSRAEADPAIGGSCRILDVSRSDFYEAQRRSAKPVVYTASVP